MATSFIRTSLIGLATIAGVCATGTSFALPQMDQGLVISKVQDPAKGTNPIFVQDSERPNKVHMVWDRVYIQPLNDGTGRPQFGLTYNEQGGLLGLTIAAGFSREAMRERDRLVGEGKEVVALQPSWGSWQFTVQNSDGTNQVLRTTSTINTALPSSPVALSLMVDATAIAYVVNAFKTGAGVGVNYIYKFRGLRPAAGVRASINWSQVRSYIKTQNVGMETSCFRGSISGTYAWFTGDASGKLCEQSTSNVRRITQALIENRTIKISNWTTSGPSARDYITKKVAELLTAMTFSPALSPTTPLPDATTPVGEECTTGDARKNATLPGAPNLNISISYCNKRSNTYIYDEEVLFENRIYEYEILDQDISEYDGAVGTHFGDLCVSQPNFFINTRTGAQGCPTVWDNTGIHTTSELGLPAPVVNGGGTAPVVIGPPPIFN